MIKHLNWDIQQLFQVHKHGNYLLPLQMKWWNQLLLPQILSVLSLEYYLPLLCDVTMSRMLRNWQLGRTSDQPMEIRFLRVNKIVTNFKWVQNQWFSYFSWSDGNRMRLLILTGIKAANTFTSPSLFNTVDGAAVKTIRARLQSGFRRVEWMAYKHNHNSASNTSQILNQ